jgi:hypothetical protein
VVQVRGEQGAEPGPRIPIDRDHLEQARRTKEPGWAEAEPQVLMLPGTGGHPYNPAEYLRDVC